MDYVALISEYREKAKSRIIHRETYEEWDDMLCVLPPESWHTDANGVNKFNMMEYDCADVTTQHARVKIDNVEHYFCKKVLGYDPTTWITLDMILEHIANEAKDDSI
jgi:hypothetical protein